MTDTRDQRPRTQHTAPADIEHEDQEHDKSVSVGCVRCHHDYLVSTGELRDGSWRRRCPVCQDGGDVSAKG